jgi:hypothetical protein
MRASGYERVADDWYVEPRSCVEALIRAEQFDGPVFDPCCGGGNIPSTFRASGYAAHGSDIANRGYGDVADFFDIMPTRQHKNIVSNPPYNVIEPFVHHALACAENKVAVLARLAFLEGRDRAANFWPRVPLSRVWVSGPRLSMPPGGTDIVAKGGSVAFAWFIFSHERATEPVIGWLP